MSHLYHLQLVIYTKHNTVVVRNIGIFDSPEKAKSHRPGEWEDRNYKTGYNPVASCRLMTSADIDHVAHVAHGEYFIHEFTINEEYKLAPRPGCETCGKPFDWCVGSYYYDAERKMHTTTDNNRFYCKEHYVANNPVASAAM